MSDDTSDTYGATTAESRPTASMDQQAPFSIFSKSQKAMIVAIASISAFFSPFSSNIYYPALEAVREDMHTTLNMINLTITMYMVFQGISPSFWGSIADMWGRRPVFILTFLCYILACVGLACAQNFATLITLRMIQSFGSSSAIAVGAGTIGDISTPSERGGYMGILSMGIMLGPLIGPFLGGVLTSQLGWRWIFWVLVIMASVVWLAQIFFLPETLRALVGNGSGYANPTPSQLFVQRRQKKKKGEEQQQLSKQIVHIEDVDTRDFSIYAVFKRIGQSFVYLKEKDVVCILVCNSADFAGMHCILSSIGPLFSSIYGLDELAVGLTFLSPGLGAFIGSYVSGKVMNWYFKKTALSIGLTDKSQLKRSDLNPKFPIEKARLGLVWYYGIPFNVLLIVYGWCLYYKVHISVVIVLNFFLAFATASVFSVTSTILVDLFPKSSAAIVALNNITRCFTAAAAILCVVPGAQSIGAGWIFTIISLVILFSRFFLFLELRYGPKWRRQRADRDNKDMSTAIPQ